MARNPWLVCHGAMSFAGLHACASTVYRPASPRSPGISSDSRRGEARRGEMRRSSLHRARSVVASGARKRKERVEKIGWPRRLKASVAWPLRVKYRAYPIVRATLAGKYILLPRNNINYRGDAARRLARKNMIYRNDRPRAGAIYARRRAPMKFSPFLPSPPTSSSFDSIVTNRSNFPFVFPLTAA